MANLYHLLQDINNGYDTYDSCVVCANSPDEARNINPAGVTDIDAQEYTWGRTWADTPNEVQVTLIGKAAKDVPLNSVVLASFNAG